MDLKGSLSVTTLTATSIALNGGGTLGSASTDVLALTGRLTLRAITNTSAAGQAREIAWSASDSKFAYNDGSAWTLFGGVGTTPGGSSGQFQYNNAGTFDGVSALTWNSGTTTVSLTSGTLALSDGVNLTFGTTTGTKFGTATTHKLGFFNAPPVTQPSQSTDLKTAFVNLGLISSTSASTSLNLGTGTTAALTAGTLTLTATLTSAAQTHALMNPTTSFTASGTQAATALSVSPTWTITSPQSGTTTYDVYINRTESSALTTGTHFLLWAGRGGTRYFSVDRIGTATLGGALYTGTVAGGIVSGSVTLDPTQGSTFDYTFTGNVTLTVSNGSSNGQRISIRVSQGGSGSYSLTWGGSNVGYGSAITGVVLSTTVGKIDYIGLQWCGTFNGTTVNKWHVVSAGANGY